MIIENPKLDRTFTLSDNTEISVQISDVILEKIKEEFNVEEVSDAHIEKFFENVLESAIIKALQ